MKKLLMLRGIPGSGKSSWAKEYIASQPTGTWKRINKDDMRALFDAGKWSGGNEKTILEVRNLLVEKFLNDGKNVIVDDTNFAPIHETTLREIAEKIGAEFDIMDFEIDLDEAIERDLKRPNSVGEWVIKRMYYAAKQRKPELNKCGEHAFICDLDGTLADITGRNPYDASSCAQDKVNSHVSWIVRTYHAKAIFMSGRDEKYRQQTIEWLEQHDLTPEGYELHMRAEGDTRKDAVVKLELFENEVNPYYRVDFVLDDRNQVVDMWRAIGLPCLQVNEGNF